MGRLLCVLGLRHDLLLAVLVEVRHEEHAALLGGQQQVLAVALVAHDFLADAFGQVVYGAVSEGRRCLHLLRAARLVFAQDCCRDEDGKGGDYVDQDARTVRDLLREAVALDVALVIQTRLHRAFISGSHSAIPRRLDRQPDGHNYRIENIHKVSLLGYYVATI